MKKLNGKIPRNSSTICGLKKMGRVKPSRRRVMNGIRKRRGY